MMLYLCLAVLSSAMISVVMRLSTTKVQGRLSMLAVNYVTCALLAAAYSGFRVLPIGETGFSAALGIGAANGVLFLTSFVLFQYSTRKNGIVLSSVFMKLGLLVPVALSVFLFHETPSVFQIVGFLLAVAAILLINMSGERAAVSAAAVLLLLLLTGGGGDAMSKVFETVGTPALSQPFLFYTFATALVLCVALLLWRRERLGRAELLFGVLIGVPNFFSAKFLLHSLSSLPGVIVYPTYSVATILLVTLVGVLLFKERLRPLQWAAMAIILPALALLNV